MRVVVVLSCFLFGVACTASRDASSPAAADAPSAWDLQPVPSTFSVCADASGDYTTIQDAIDDAPSGALITVCAGTYSESLVIDGKSVALASADGVGAAVIDGGGTGRALRVENTPSPGFAMQGFVVQNGTTTYNGGGLYAHSAILVLEDNSFLDNDATGDGAGVWARSTEVRAVGNHFEGNVADSEGGGAMFDQCTGRLLANAFTDNSSGYGGGLAVTDSSGLRITANTMTENSADVHGGGLYVEGDAPIENNVISDNVAGDDGGGLYLDQGAGLVVGNTITGNEAANDGGGAYTSVSSALIAGNTFQDNVALDDAGGLRIYVGTSLIVDNLIAYNTAYDAGGGVKLSHAEGRFLRNEVVGNVTADRGGGVELDNDTTLIRDCLFSGNQAALGGGLHGMNNHSTQVIEDSSFVDNVATTYGGGLMLETDSYAVTLRQLDFSGNQAPEGAGLHALDAAVWGVNLILADNAATTFGGGLSFDGSSGMLANLVAWGNDAPIGAGLYMLNTGTVRVSNSILSENSGGAALGVSGTAPMVGFTAAWNNAGGDYLGMSDPTGADGNISADPMFVDALNHDFHLVSGSPAIDAGVPFLRDADGSVSDMGAYGGPCNW